MDYHDTIEKARTINTDEWFKAFFFFLFYLTAAPEGINSLRALFQGCDYIFKGENHIAM